MGRRTGDIITSIVGVKEEDEEESLSLCGLPMNEGNDILQSDKESPVVGNDNNIKEESGEEEEFNFSDSFTISREYSEMCAADELFFQGQILPLRRHSVSCTTTDHTGDANVTEFINSSGSSSTRWQTDHIRFTGKNSRSDSLDRCYSGGLTSTATSSRSSSINSHHSSSSGSSCSSASASASAAVTAVSKHNKKPPNSRARPLKLVPNHFQYYSPLPSPKPQIRTSSGTKTNSNKNSGLWSLFRVGLMTPPEIAIGDLKNRSNSIKNYNPQSFGSRNSSTSSNSNTTSTTTTTTKTIIPAKRKQPFFIFNKNGALFFGGCKCTASSVFGPNNPTRNGAREEEIIKQQATKTTKHRREGGGEGGGGGGEGGKQALSRHRTFEWLKQLSLESPATDNHQT